MSALGSGWSQMASALEAEQKLAAFGAAVLSEHRGIHGPGDVDAATLESLAEKHGVLERRQVTEPCGESCVCAQVDNIPGQCLFVPDSIQPFLKD